MKFSTKFTLAAFLLANIAALSLLSCKESAAPQSSPSTDSKVSTTQTSQPPATANLNLKTLDDSLKGADRCQQCHQQEHKDWMGSHHEMAMKPATKENVVGDFNNAEFVHKGDTYKFYMKGDDYYALSQNGKGEMEEFKITYTFGIHPLQQYIVEFPDGKKQCLHTAWDDVKKRWYHLYENVDVEPGEWLHWSRGGQNWNQMCADCHSTELKKNYDPETKQYSTTYKEINVSCEACHGPSEEHILAKLNPDKNLPEGELFVGLKKDKTPVNKTEIDKCARCHSRRAQITDHYDHVGKFMDHYLPEILRDGLYHDDGQILDEVYVYGSFAQSKMYHNNVRCSDCHNPHSNKLKFEGNALCMQCHSSKPEKAYDSPAHHFHAQGSEGAKCVNCHMPGRTYMGIDFRRDHSLRVPRPDLSVKHGTPNACNDCHSDKDFKWAADAVTKHFGPKRAPHFSEVLAAAREDNFNNPLPLIALARDTAQPAIARATAIWMMMSFPSNETYACAADMLSDKEPLVRFHAMSTFSGLPKVQRKPLAKLLSDEIRAVRIEAANLLADFKPEELEHNDRAPFSKALTEYENYLKHNADSAAGQLNLGNLYTKLEDRPKALKALREAIAIDKHFNMARINLAYMLSMDGKLDEAEKVYLKVLEQEPNYANAWYSLGLLYSEQKKFDKAEEAFDKASMRMPGNIRIFYNRALCLQKLDRKADAEKAFEAGLTNFKGNQRSQQFAETLYALILLQIEMGNRQKAERNSEILANIVGKNHPFMNYIKEKAQESLKK
ncbi:MAG: tetratricopeptide repeat protein [Lentisphaerales bacterium]|nr:tetratricopeptide repeat protein [Lentisphaerales bacterium]